MFPVNRTTTVRHLPFFLKIRSYLYPFFFRTWKLKQEAVISDEVSTDNMPVNEEITDSCVIHRRKSRAWKRSRKKVTFLKRVPAS